MCMLRAVCWAGPAGAWPRDVSFTAAHEGSGCDVRLCAVFLMSVRARVCGGGGEGGSGCPCWWSGERATCARLGQLQRSHCP